MTRRNAGVYLFTLVLLTGCAKHPTMTQASAPAPTGAATATTASGKTSTPATRTAAATAAAASRQSTIRPKLEEYKTIADLKDIHFDFDRYELRDGDRGTLDAHAEWMKAHPSALLLVEGHCDERGTNEYNISLGERRAKTTSNYLTSRGIASGRITVVSYGEERPLCQQHGEACWSQNRRAHFLVKLQ
jgi:peptidoglycan-associated lipoprotein